MLWLAGAMVLIVAGTAAFFTTDISVEDADPDHTAPPETSDGPDLVQGVTQDPLYDATAEDQAVMPALEENTLSAKYQAVFDAAAQLDEDQEAETLVLNPAWIAAGETAAITDFEPARDSLLFVWDDTTEAAIPSDVTVQTDPSNTSELQVWMGNEKMAQVSGASDLTPVDISLIPLSSAKALSFISA